VALAVDWTLPARAGSRRVARDVLRNQAKLHRGRSEGGIAGKWGIVISQLVGAANGTGLKENNALRRLERSPDGTGSYRICRRELRLPIPGPALWQVVALIRNEPDKALHSYDERAIVTPALIIQAPRRKSMIANNIRI
jgi:hypothetical protein